MPEQDAKFALDFFRRLSYEDSNKNIMFSPPNLTAALGLFAYGGGEEEEARIEKVGVIKEHRCKPSNWADLPMLHHGCASLFLFQCNQLL